VPSKSKAKGNRFEREVVKLAKEYGLESKRAWGSDGRSLGLHPEVDITIEEYTVQCKVRKRIAEWLKPSEQIGGLHLQCVKESRGQMYAIMSMTDLMEIMVRLKTLSGDLKQGREQE
jgi:Holliday junction resolvase